MATYGSLVLEIAGDIARLRRDMGEVRRTVDQGLAGVQRSARQVDALSNSFRALGSVVAGAISVQSLRTLINTADQWRQLEARIKLATSATGDFERVQAQLLSIAQTTGVRFGDSVQVFQRLAVSAEALGASNSQILRVVESVQKLGAVSGAGTQQLTAGLLQFSQALATGRVQAEEINSILENLPAVAREIERGMGLLPGTLRSAVKEGRVLSQDIFNALLKQSADIDQQFAQIPGSIERASNSLSNAFGAFLGQLNSALSLTDRIAKGLQSWGAIIGGVTRELRTGGGIEEGIRRVDELVREQLSRIADLQETRRRIVAAGDSFRAPGGAGADEVVANIDQQIAEARRRVEVLNDALRKSADEQAGLVITINKGQEDATKTLAAGIGRQVEARKKGNVRMAELMDEHVEDWTRYRERLFEISERVKDEIDPNREIVRQLEDIRQATIAGYLAWDEYARAVERVQEAEEEKLIEAQYKVLDAQEEVNRRQREGLDEISTAVDDTARSMADAFAEFAESGKLSVRDLVESILQDLARLLIRQAITEPLAKGLGDAIKGIFGGGGGDSGFAGFLNSLFPNARGGLYRVGGGSGEHPVAFRARAGEIVAVGTPGGSGGAGGGTFVFNIQANDTRGFDDLLTRRAPLIEQIVTRALNKQGRKGITR